MKTKLTLRVDSELIASAKKYSAESGKSLSQIVTDLFQLMRHKETRTTNQMTPAVRTLKGALKGKAIDKNDYQRYLEEKYS